VGKVGEEILAGGEGEQAVRREDRFLWVSCSASSIFLKYICCGMSVLSVLYTMFFSLNIDLSCLVSKWERAPVLSLGEPRGSRSGITGSR
jgi:hypothetical protein